MNRERWIEEVMSGLRAQHEERRIRVFPGSGGKLMLDGREFLNFSCNDYLGLSKHPRVIASAKKALDEYGAGSTASRLVSGSLSWSGHLPFTSSFSVRKRSQPTQ